MASESTPLSPSALQQQFDTMFNTFKVMGLNPQGDTPEEFNNWIKEYAAKSKDQDKKPPDTKPPLLQFNFDKSTAGAIPKTTSHQNKHLETQPMYSAHPPKLKSFSGGDNKGETPYDIWRYEVKMLQKDLSYTQSQKELAIRRALTGSAARTIIYQGLDKSIDELLATLDSVYGNVDNKEQLLQDFYSAKQKEDEDVTSWSNRLQEIIGRGVDKGLIQQAEVNNMLHNMLYTGLRQELKDVSGHKFDSIKDFNRLRVELRRIERDHMPQKSTKPNTAKAATTEKSEVDDLKGMVRRLDHKVDELSQNQQNMFQQHQQYQGRSWNRGNNHRGKGGYNRRNRHQYQQHQQPDWQNYQPQPDWQYQQQPYWQNQQQKDWYNAPPQPAPQHQPVQQEQEPPEDDKIYCKRCGQEGHIQIGCRVRMDHSRKHLNGKKPGRRGQY